MGCRLLQLNFNFEKRSSYLLEDFLVSSCNVEAFSFIESWPNWVSRAVSIHGPEGSGKTHLLNVWAKAAGAVVVDESMLTEERLPEILSVSKCVAVDVDDKLPDEETLFHLINLINQEQGYLLIASRTPPARWQVNLLDLWSRLRGMMSIELKDPDEDTLYAIMLKEFCDREIRVKPEVLKYLVNRIPRSFKCAIDSVRLLDRAALSQKCDISIRLIKEVLPDLARDN